MRQALLSDDAGLITLADMLVAMLSCADIAPPPEVISGAIR